MKPLKTATLVAGLFIAFSGYAKAETDFGNIHKGNLQTGGTINFSHGWQTGSSFLSLQISSPTEYFLLDHLSLGGTVSYFHSGGPSYNYDSFGVGPSGTYYFWTQDHLAAYLGEEFSYNKTSGSSIYTSYCFNSRTKLGVKYFLTPSVAIGPSIEYTHQFGRQEIPTADSISLIGAFSIHF